MGTLLYHIGTSAIMDLLLRLLTCVEWVELRKAVIEVTTLGVRRNRIRVYRNSSRGLKQLSGSTRDIVIHVQLSLR